MGKRDDKGDLKLRRLIGEAKSSEYWKTKSLSCRANTPGYDICVIRVNEHENNLVILRSEIGRDKPKHILLGAISCLILNAIGLILAWVVWLYAY